MAGLNAIYVWLLVMGGFGIALSVDVQTVNSCSDLDVLAQNPRGVVVVFAGTTCETSNAMVKTLHAVAREWALEDRPPVFVVGDVKTGDMSQCCNVKQVPTVRWYVKRSTGGSSDVPSGKVSRLIQQTYTGPIEAGELTQWVEDRMWLYCSKRFADSNSSVVTPPKNVSLDVDRERIKHTILNSFTSVKGICNETTTNTTLALVNSTLDECYVSCLRAVDCDAFEHSAPTCHMLKSCDVIAANPLQRDRDIFVKVMDAVEATSATSLLHTSPKLFAPPSSKPTAEPWFNRPKMPTADPDSFKMLVRHLSR